MEFIQHFQSAHIRKLLQIIPRPNQVHPVQQRQEKTSQDKQISKMAGLQPTTILAASAGILGSAWNSGKPPTTPRPPRESTAGQQ